MTSNPHTATKYHNKMKYYDYEEHNYEIPDNDKHSGR
jgi:hypothetical protein